jgi:curved DNA-binding protein CbpA
MNGQLSVQPLAELVHEISASRLSGVLRLERERVKAAVYFEVGQTVAALTNLRAFRLAEVLRRSGAIDPARLGEAVGEGMSDEQAGVALVRGGLLSPAELKRLQERQSSDVLRELLGWPEGEWAFDPRVRLAGGYRARAEVPRLLVEAARNLPAEFVSRRMSDDDETITPRADALERVEGGVQLLPAEAFVLSRINAPMSLGEIVAVSGLPENETRRAVYALALGGLLEREHWPRALPDDVLREAARQSRAASQDKARAEAQQQEQQPQEPQAQEPVEERNARGDIEELFERAGGATHYEVLGVARSAAADEIKRVYYSLARRLHPDRFRRDTDADSQQKIDAAFAKIAQAYDTLKDSSARAAYDIKLSKQRAARGPDEAKPQQPREQQAARTSQPQDERRAAPGAPSQTASQDTADARDAEQKFQQGLDALRRNDAARARTLFGEAAQLAPKQARYRAHFGRALASDRATRRQAEAELQAAVSLDASNASYRIMLAELYRDVNLRRKAEAELERALALDPHNAQALRLLEELRRAS